MIAMETWDVFLDGVFVGRVRASTARIAAKKARKSLGPGGGKISVRVAGGEGGIGIRRPNPKKKASPKKRISTALTRWLKKQNPAMKKARAVRVQRLKGGVIKFTPEK